MDEDGVRVLPPLLVEQAREAAERVGDLDVVVHGIRSLVAPSLPQPTSQVVAASPTNWEDRVKENPRLAGKPSWLLTQLAEAGSRHLRLMDRALAEVQDDLLGPLPDEDRQTPTQLPSQLRASPARVKVPLSVVSGVYGTLVACGFW